MWWFKPQAPSISLGEIRLTVKQVDASSLTSAQALAMKWAFPGFLDTDTKLEDLDEGTKILMSASSSYHIATKPPKRYSGTWDGPPTYGRFPSGRYYTVCNDATGFDEYTLMREVLSYWRSPRSVRLDLFDLSGKESIADLSRLRALVGNSNLVDASALTEVLDKPGQFRKALCLCFLPTAIDESSYARAVGADPDNLTFVTIPYSVGSLTEARVLDLRLLKAQRWLHATFGRPNALHFEKGTIEWQKINAGKYRSFSDLIPCLLDQYLGGGDLTRAIGMVARLSGARGIVFPSARTDPFVRTANGELISQGGWNYVSFRDLGTEDILIGMVGFHEEWDSRVPEYAVVTVDTDRNFEGSWSVNGIHNGRMAWLRSEMLKPDAS